MKKAIVVGASSGIGRALAKILANEGYIVGLVARRVEKLLELQKEIKGQAYIKQIDVTNRSEARESLHLFIQEMGGVDLIVVNAGILFNNWEFEWEKEKSTIETNVLGFSAMAHLAMTYFLSQGKGHLVGISSIAAIRGTRFSPSYGASKAFVSNFLDALRVIAFKEKKDICVTDIQPGWVDTDMIKGKRVFWVASPEQAAQGIYLAIKQRRSHAYLTHRWRLAAWFLKIAPKWLRYRVV